MKIPDRGRQLASNSIAQLVGAVFSMAASVIVVAVAARHYGPDGLGQLYYAVAFVALFSAIGSLSMDTVVVKSLASDGATEREGLVLGTAFSLRILGGVAVTLVATGVQCLLLDGGSQATILVLVMSTVLTLRAFEVIDFWAQVHFRAWPFTVIKIGTISLVATLKVTVVAVDGSLLIYALTYVVDVLLVGLASLLLYRRIRESGVAWRFDGTVARSLLLDSAPLMGAGIMIAIYGRLDQVLLGVFLPGKEAVGIYAAGVVLSEMWYFVPIALVTTLRGTVLSADHGGRNRDKGLILMFSVVAWTSLIIVTLLAVLAKPVVSLLYGPAFLAAVDVLPWLLLAGIFSMLGVARAVWLVREGLHRYALIHSASACATSVALNSFLIPRYGIEGAAVSRLGAQLVSFVVLAIFPKTRHSFWLSLKAFSPSVPISTLREVAVRVKASRLVR